MIFSATERDFMLKWAGYGNTGKKLSSIVKCYNPSDSDSRERYAWILRYLADAAEEAIQIRLDN